MAQETLHPAGCFCGKVHFALSGEPVVMGYCHCESCRRWSASPVNAFAMWPLDHLQVVQGEELVCTFSKTPQALRKWCKVCGGHLFTEHPGMGLTDVPAAAVEGLAFRPTLHVNYKEAVLPIRDGLPKLSDLPSEFGGTGTPLPE
jgi:hypothetical protein